jgi:hypothetical protein
LSDPGGGRLGSGDRWLGLANQGAPLPGGDREGIERNAPEFVPFAEHPPLKVFVTRIRHARGLGVRGVATGYANGRR